MNRRHAPRRGQSVARRQALACRPAVTFGVMALVGALGLTACGGSSKTSTANASTTTVPAAAGPGAAAGVGGGGRILPAASGSVAAITGTSMEVQNPTAGQVTVSWTTTSAFSETATVTSAAVVAGDCVTVTGTSASGVITARTVVISKPRGGTCAIAAFGRGGFARRAGAGTGAGGSSTGRRFGGAGGLTVAGGKVTSVTATSLVLTGFSSAGLSRAATTSTTKPATTTVDVTLAATTTYTETKAASAAALAVGDCITATGRTSTTGAVTASTIRITSTGGQTCTTGFGGFGRGGSASGASGA